MYVALTGEVAPTIQRGEIVIVTNILASSGLREPRQCYTRYLADVFTAKAILSGDISKEWHVTSSTNTKILLLFNGSSKEFLGNPDDICELKSILLQ